MLNSIIYQIKSLLKKPFKVAIITYRYPGESPTNTGVGIHSYYLSRGLAKLGCEVHVFCFGKGFNKTEYIGEGKHVIHKIDTKVPAITSDKFLSRWLSGFIFDNKVMEAVIKENQKDKFDIIHSNSRLLGGIFISKYLSNVKWINTVHSLEKDRLKLMTGEEKKYANIFKWMEDTIQYADAVIAVSKKLKEEILKGYKLKEKKVFYIPNGVDLDLFKPDNSIQEEKKILYVGRFSPEKGIDIIPKIANTVLQNNKDLKFEVIASGEKIPLTLEKVKKQFELLEKLYPQRFIWKREIIKREDLSKEYNKAMIVIQPSRYDSFPTTVLEAMATGKAVIVSNRGGMPEMVENAGMVIPLDTKYFSKAILRLVKDYKLRERYARKALERSKNYGWDSIIKQTLDLYKMITKKTNDSKEEANEKVYEGLKNLEELQNKTKD